MMHTEILIQSLGVGLEIHGGLRGKSHIFGADRHEFDSSSAHPSHAPFRQMISEPRFFTPGKRAKMPTPQADCSSGS